MADRELLEKAARAASIEWLCWDTERQAFKLPPGGSASRWNALADDGDAFRLAVQRHLYVRYHAALAQGIASDIAGNEWWVNVEDCGRDPGAATRRAIVLAAAGESPSRAADCRPARGATGLRLLTGRERQEAYSDCREDESDVEAIQRKFCEVNGLPLPNGTAGTDTDAVIQRSRERTPAPVAGTLRHQRTGLPLKGCPAANAIKGNHERDAYGHCALCGDGPARLGGTDGR
jgi:hypothetical protein